MVTRSRSERRLSFAAATVSEKTLGRETHFFLSLDMYDMEWVSYSSGNTSDNNRMLSVVYDS